MSIKQHIQNCYVFILERLTQLIENHNLGYVFDSIIEYFQMYPTLSVILSIFLACYSVPVGIFLCFSLLSLLVGFTGFIVIEGALLGVAFVLLLSVLSILTAIVSAVLLLFLLVYTVIVHVYHTFYPDLMIQMNIPHLSQSHNYNNVHQDNKLKNNLSK